MSLPPLVEIPPEITVAVPGLESDGDVFQSCVRSLQMSYLTIPHVSVCRVFRLLGRGRDLLADKNFSVWNFLKESGPRRASLLGKLETGYRTAVLRHDKPTHFSTTTTPSVSRISTVNSNPSPDPSLGRINVSVSRCSGSSHDDPSKKIKPKPVMSKKTDLQNTVKQFLLCFLFWFDLFRAFSSLYYSDGH